MQIHNKAGHLLRLCFQPFLPLHWHSANPQQSRTIIPTTFVTAFIGTSSRKIHNESQQQRWHVCKRVSWQWRFTVSQRSRTNAPTMIATAFPCAGSLQIHKKPGQQLQQRSQQHFLALAIYEPKKQGNYSDHARNGIPFQRQCADPQQYRTPYPTTTTFRTAIPCTGG